MLQFATRSCEMFAGVFLDTQLKVLPFEELFRGKIDGCSVHPREVVNVAPHHNAAALIFAHYVPRNIMRTITPRASLSLARPTSRLPAN